MTDLLTLCAAAGLGAYCLVGLVRRHVVRKDLVDVPNERSLHSIPIPRGGGLGIVAAFLLAVLFAGLVGIARFDFILPLLAGAIPIAWIGWRDDHGHVAPKWRALVHVGASVLALAFVVNGFGVVLPWPQRALLVYPNNLLILGLGAIAGAYFLNLYNFMDGLDGLAASEGAFVGLATYPMLRLAIMQERLALTMPEAGPHFAWVGNVAHLAPLLGCCCLGFLVWNWPPARIFMGDVCSGFLGFVYAFFALTTSWELPRLAWVWLILLGVFLVDGSYTLAIRFVTGQRWHEAHRLHAFQKAALRASGHRPVTLSVLAINILWLLPLACLAAANPNLAPWITGAALAPLAAVARFYKAGQVESPASVASAVPK